MAAIDLKTFIENRLLVLDPAQDISPGSPAQVQFVDPLIAYLGTDPIETDIKAFILDRFSQELPDLYAGDPGVISDTFIKPLTLMLEPFKREIQSIKKNQSLKDPTVLSDDDADALVANVFDERTEGGLAGGVARVFFTNPTNVQVEITTQFFTAGGLNFFPSTPVSINAEEMVFNRSGSSYFMDLTVQAEQVGAEYNIDKNTLTGVTGIFGAIKVDNPRSFGDGATKIDTPSFVAQARSTLTERSMVTRRGATAILTQTFRDTVRAVQIIGAGDAEMQRDIMVATSPGHAWLTGTVGLFKKLAYVRCRTVDDASITPTVQVGDQVYVYLKQFGTGSYPGTPQAERIIRFTVAEVLIGPMLHPADPEFQLSFLVRVTESAPASIAANVLVGKFFEGGLIKKGNVTVSSIPGAALVNPLTIKNQEVHVLGHSDVYVRPVLQVTSTVTVDSLSADPGTQSLQRSHLSTTASSNVVSDTFASPAINFSNAGVVPGDFLVIESGSDIGTYAIRKAVGTSLYLSVDLSSTAGGTVRYRIIKDLTFNPFNPRILKLPFGSIPNNDLQTLIGSSTLVFSGPTTDLLNYGVKIGDVVRVFGSTVELGTFTITGFIDGQHALVDRPAVGSESGLVYEIYTPLNKVELPLVRLKQLMVLDSAKQNTGVTIPPAEPVAVVPQGHITSAQVRSHSEDRSGFVLPDLTKFMSPLPSVAIASTPPGRFSSGFEKAKGVYQPILFATGAQDEFDFLPDFFGKCSFFIATSEDISLAENFPPIDPKPEDALTLKSGPNKGDYLIKDVIKLRYKEISPTRDVWVYIIQIYGTFPVDVLSELTSFLNTAALAPTFAASAVQTYSFGGNGPLPVPSWIRTTIYSNFGTKLFNALTAFGVTPPSAVDLQAFVDEMTKVSYSWGDPARGVLRSYFSEPTLFQQHTAANLNPTIYSFKTAAGEVLKFRSDPNRYEKQEMIPPRLEIDADPLDYPRDLVGSAAAAFLQVATLTDSTRETVFNLGIRVGDFLSVHEEFLLLGSTGTVTLGADVMAAVKTVYNSTQVTFVNSPTPFTQDMIGGLLFVEEGADKGGYRVVKVLDSKNLALDKPLTVTTPTSTSLGGISSWGYDLGVLRNRVESSSPIFVAGDALKYITIYGIDSRYQGSYKILTVDSPTFVTIEYTGFGPTNMPNLSFPISGEWVITAAPPAPPTKTGTPKTGTELYALRPIRVYRSLPQDFYVSDVTTSPTVSSVTLSVPATSLRRGVNQPFRIYRPDIRRVTPYEMSLQSAGGMFYFDTEVLSLGPGDSNNLTVDSYLTADSGTYESFGYRHLVDDDTLTYSTKETGKLLVPSTILPTNSPDSLDNFISLVGAPIQISYDKGDIVQNVQDFLGSPEDRVTVANMLARHFLPSYVSYDASYVGGSAPGVIAKDIISYIDNLAIEVALDVSEVQKLIENRGGNLETPTVAFILTHDWDRRRWAELSANKLGGTTTLVPYNGTPRVTFLAAGPDVSGVTPTPTGERVLLTRL